MEDREAIRNKLQKEIRDYNRSYITNFFYFVGFSLILGIGGAMLFGTYIILFTVVPIGLLFFCGRFGLPKSMPKGQKRPKDVEIKPYTDSLDAVYCPDCGARTDAGDLFCPKCARKL